ncbi:DUF6258 family protein [Paraherbaspirillum soli]|uniref:DUF6258 family protein n=1 Tax=Paraherbaspirillum soli TaxID=631222 RepID=A0ABW0MEI3_9BURK
MNPVDFLKTIYLGDRSCKAILIYSWDELVKLQVDEISRVRSSSGQWEFYNDENIEDGFLVFEEVQSISFKPENFLPNDYINDIEVHKLEGSKYCRFVLYIGSIGQDRHPTEIEICITAANMRLENKQGHNVP